MLGREGHLELITRAWGSWGSPCWAAEHGYPRWDGEVVLCAHSLRFCPALLQVLSRIFTSSLWAAVCWPARSGLRWNLPVDRWWHIMESQTIPDIFIRAPPGRIQRLSLMKGYFVLSSLVGKLTIIAYSLGSGAHSFTCGLSVFPTGEASYPCCESVIDALGLGAPSYPFRKQEGWRDSAQVFFHSPCFLTLITFCCGKEMRWGLKTDHCPPPRLMQRKRYCLLNG